MQYKINFCFKTKLEGKPLRQLVNKAGWWLTDSGTGFENLAKGKIRLDVRGKEARIAFNLPKDRDIASLLPKVKQSVSRIDGFRSMSLEV